jgi:ribose transport system permease protein
VKSLLNLLGRQTALIVFLGIFLLFTVLLGQMFLSPGNLSHIARNMAIDAPVAMGQSIILIAGGIDISVGPTMAMAAALSVGLQEYGLVASVGAAIAFGAIVGAVNGLLVTKAKIVPFIATLGTMSIVQGMMLMYTHEGSISNTIRGFAFWGGGQVGGVPMPFIIVAPIMVFLWWLLRSFSIGREMYAVGGNKETAYLAGVPVIRVQFSAFVLCGILAAVSGVLLASSLQSANAQIGTSITLLSITAAVIGGASVLGGRGGVVGAVLGIAALITLTSGMNLLGVRTYYQLAANALLLIVVVGVDAILVNRSRLQLARLSPELADYQPNVQKKGQV